MGLSRTLTIFLAVGTVFMSVPILIVSKRNGIRLWKGAVAAVLLTVVGTIGTLLMYYVENGRIGGVSFYGAVFLVPVVFALIALVLRVPYGEMLDLCAVGECVMLALMKVRCLMGSCCIGRVLYTTQNGPIRFPSREVEMAVAIVIFIVLMRWVKKGLHKGELYTWYLLLYGSTRFVLNFLRAEWQEWTGRIPMGTIWSVCAVLIGLAALFISKKKLDRKNEVLEK